MVNILDQYEPMYFQIATKNYNDSSPEIQPRYIPLPANLRKKILGYVNEGNTKRNKTILPPTKQLVFIVLNKSLDLIMKLLNTELTNKSISIIAKIEIARKN